MIDPQKVDSYPDPPESDDCHSWALWVVNHPDTKTAIRTVRIAEMEMMLLEWLVGWVTPDLSADFHDGTRCGRANALVYS